MTKNELKELLLEAIKQNNGKTPLHITIEDKEYTWNGGQRIGNQYLYKYRKSSEICEVKDEKCILV